MQKLQILFLVIMYPLCIQSQEFYPVSEIDSNLLQNTNAVVRNYSRKIIIEDLDKVVVKTNKVITILNEKGNRFLGAYELYDNSEKIKEQKATIYDRNGEELEKFKSRDFRDQSNYPSFVLFADNRVSILDYVPRSYPYTISYTSEVESVNSVFLPDWWPLNNYNISVENSSYQIINEIHAPLRFLESNLDNMQLEKDFDDFNLHYRVRNIAAMQQEALSPDFSEVAPKLLVALGEFHLAGVNGKAENWKEFGKWQYENLVKGHDELPEETIAQVRTLVKDANSLEEKAELIYDYVQNKTRYIAIALGIGGWEPAYANEVDHLGYGDCKGLTNYTKALLKSQGIEAYYTVVHSGDKIDIDPKFTKMQGNHVILNIPREEGEDIWLECTSQYSPFNYLGDFTDDRYVLKITPEGGEIVKTKKYSAEDNLQKITCTIAVEDGGGFHAVFNRQSTGIPYGDIFPIARQTEEIQKQYYREKWSHLRNISFDEIKYSNSKDSIRFTEQLMFHGDKFAVKAGSRMLLPLNFINNHRMQLPDDKNRQHPIKMSRGKTYSDTFKYIIPKAYVVEAFPEGTELTTDFGSFSFQVEKQETENAVELIVRRSLMFKEGEWAPERYQDFKSFMNAIGDMNNQKAVIIEKI
ncbi:DUF3857 domain-containing protein [Zunongwangia sp. F260]|uniref:DUF3857 domain-containing protein n=1 Tax=Autumnicola lenta TaxID=3075593 RepID=A0ABU3CHC2_9FLAO|nr:DUF3857 domain-containing protein [Zunongwangia sp. F260]MDT0645385.1 DUF3857 domain-containing protein [Zunongwangia sp. F260]